MKRILTVFMLLLVCTTLAADPLTPAQLLERIRAEKVTEQEQMQAREQRFLTDKNQQQQLHGEAMGELTELEAESARLKALFAEQEQQLTMQEQQLKERTGELGELFSVLRQSAGDLSGQWQGSMLNVQFPDRLTKLERFAADRRLPGAADIEHLWLTVLEDLTASGKVERLNAPVIAADGSRNEESVLRVGSFSAYSANGFLVYQDGDDAFRALPRQPAGIHTVTQWAGSSEAVATLPVDPTRGGLIQQLQQKPGFFQRVQQGGLVGWVIITLGVFGLLLAVWRLLWLQAVVGRVKKQMRDLDSPRTDNPLGRVLTALGPKPEQMELEPLELKLDEAVMQEVPKLEMGQGLIKLLAAVAPLLGLLGTVTGMIITFQAITQAGGGDSRMMADGISQALVTTVQGLVVAIPLLFLHSILAARSKGVVQLLEQQCIGLLALQMSDKSSRD